MSDKQSDAAHIPLSEKSLPVYKRCVPASREAAYAVLEAFEIWKLGEFTDDEWAEMITRMHQALVEVGLFEGG